MTKVNQLFKLASVFEKKLAQTPSYKDKLLAALKPDVKAALEHLDVTMADSSISYKFKLGTLFKDKLVKSLQESVKQTLGYDWHLKEAGY